MIEHRQMQVQPSAGFGGVESSLMIPDLNTRRFFEQMCEV